MKSDVLMSINLSNIKTPQKIKKIFLLVKTYRRPNVAESMMDAFFMILIFPLLKEIDNFEIIQKNHILMKMANNKIA